VAAPTGRRVAPQLGAALLCGLTIVLVSRNAGGWFATTWGWAALVLLFVAAAALIALPALPVQRLDLAFLGVLSGLTAWTALSLLWTESTPSTVLEVERTLVYLAAAAAVLFVVRRRSFAAALGGVLAADAVLCGYALATRLVPDHVVQANSSLGFRLAGVYQYPNAIGLAAAMGLLLALGFVCDGRGVVVRAAAGASTVLFALTLSLSTSRGAWVALVAGLAAASGLSPRRRELAGSLLPVAAVAALAIWLASRSDPISRFPDPGSAAHDGHRMIFTLVFLGAAAACVSVRRTRIAVIAALAALLVAVVLAPSTPVGIALAASASIRDVPGAPPPGETPGGRLFSTTSNSRTAYWRVAAGDFARHPIVGSGAGTFVREWYRHRRTTANVQDAHSLYVETLAELGLVGLALLAAVLAMPVVAAVRARGEPLVAATFGAFVAYAVHTGVDWDWELPGLTLMGLLCGSLLVVAARRDDAASAVDRRWHVPLLTLVLPLLAFALVGLVGNRAQAAALDAVTRRDWGTAETQAKRAAMWAPWSAQALVLEADVASAHNDRLAQRAYLRRAVGKDDSDFELWRRLAAVSSGVEREHALARAALLDPLG
jgi:O-antigen ligase